jgi:hypothetical protein
MNKINFLTVAFCLFAGQVWADNVYLPTVAYRDMGTYSRKFEYAYDSFGHIISEKVYNKMPDASQYSLSSTRICEYQQLSNGEFAITKLEKLDDKRYTAAYDNNGMQFWKQAEMYYNGQWYVFKREEAILNTNNVRTGIRTHERNSVYDDLTVKVLPVTFDDKGRVLEVKNDNGSVVLSCTWGSELREWLSMSINGYLFTNIVPVGDIEYFDPYVLNPGVQSKPYDLLSVIEDDVLTYSMATELLLMSARDKGYVWNDYKLHTLGGNIDVFTDDEERTPVGTYRVTIDESKGEITRIATLDDEKTVTQKLSNGGWSEIITSLSDDGRSPQETRREYDTYGALTKFYYPYNYYDDVYSREYDAEGHPTKTVYYNTGVKEWEETYDAWVEKGATGINSIATPKLSVYISGGKLQISGYELQEKDAIAIFDLSGCKVGSSTDVTRLPLGVYIVKIGAQSAKVIKQ